MARLYLDVCCLNRPFDDQSQPRMRLASEAILVILSRVEAGDHDGMGSEVLLFEIDQNPDAARRDRVRILARLVKESVVVTDDETRRAEELVARGFHTFDAMHVACAESASADMLLTTDDRLLRLAAHRKSIGLVD